MNVSSHKFRFSAFFIPVKSFETGAPRNFIPAKFFIRRHPRKFIPVKCKYFTVFDSSFISQIYIFVILVNKIKSTNNFFQEEYVCRKATN